MGINSLYAAKERMGYSECYVSSLDNSKDVHMIWMSLSLRRKYPMDIFAEVLHVANRASNCVSGDYIGQQQQTIPSVD